MRDFACLHNIWVAGKVGIPMHTNFLVVCTTFAFITSVYNWHINKSQNTYCYTEHGKVGAVR